MATISMYEVAVVRLSAVLENLSHLLDIAQAQVDAGRADMATLLDQRLIADMYPLAQQVRIACDKARSVVARLAGMEVPHYEDDEASFAELQRRIARSVAFLRSVPRARIDGTEDKVIELPVRHQATRYRGLQLLLGHSLPNVYFHAVTAYDILRQQGVPVGKRDFLGNP